MAHNNIHTRNSIENKISKLTKAKKHSSGLKSFHIGNVEWKVGRSKLVNDPTKKKSIHGDFIQKIEHCVIYGPDRKEFHVYGNDVSLLRKDYTYIHNEGSHIVRHGNDAIEASAKIYALTHILDERSKWCFDLEKIPLIGQLKVIYDNGTVKNIEFNGSFERVEIKRKHLYNLTKLIKPVGYRIQ